MVAAVVVDVGDGGIEAVDHLDGEDRRGIFGQPVFFGGRLHFVGPDQRAGGGTAAQLHALVEVDLADRRQERLGHHLVHQQGFHGVAGAVALGLGVVADRQCLFQIGIDIDVGVAVAVEVLDHRNACFGTDAGDQALAAARHDHVDVFRHGDQQAHGGPVGGFQHLHGAGRQAGRGQPFVHAGGNGLVGAERLAAAAQDAGIAGLQAQPGRVGGHVGARLVDDADHAQRHAHLAKLDPARTVGKLAHFAHRVRQGGNLAQAFGHAGHGFFRQGQAVDHRRRQSGRHGSLHVVGVGGQQLGRIALDGIGHGQQCGILGPGIGTGQFAAGSPRRPPQVLHVGVKVHLGFRHQSGLDNRDVITGLRPCAPRPAGHGPAGQPPRPCRLAQDEWLFHMENPAECSGLIRAPDAAWPAARPTRPHRRSARWPVRWPVRHSAARPAP